MQRCRFAIALGCMGVILQACTSTTTDQVLDPGTPSTAAPGAALPAPAPLPPPAPAPETPAVSGVTTVTRVELAPVVGATVDAARPLSARLEARGRASGIDFRGRGAADIRYVLKGYLSALPEDDDTLIIYVWDVMDIAGNRLHRIQGQERAPKADGADAWATVPAQTMEGIADRTVTELALWLRAPQR